MLKKSWLLSLLSLTIASSSVFAYQFPAVIFTNNSKSNVTFTEVGCRPTNPANDNCSIGGVSANDVVPALGGTIVLSGQAQGDGIGMYAKLNFSNGATAFITIGNSLGRPNTIQVEFFCKNKAASNPPKDKYGMPESVGLTKVITTNYPVGTMLANIFVVNDECDW